jgi:hypothetical protein
MLVIPVVQEVEEEPSQALCSQVEEATVSKQDTELEV